jgi:hypothetical protein
VKRVTYYHAGPKGLTELKTARELIDDDDEPLTVEGYAEAWEAKWGDAILDPMELMAHPAVDEICLTADRAEAEELAKQIGGCAYLVDVGANEVTTNNEGYPTVRRWQVGESPHPVLCVLIEAEVAV